VRLFVFTLLSLFNMPVYALTASVAGVGARLPDDSASPAYTQSLDAAGSMTQGMGNFSLLPLFPLLIFILFVIIIVVFFIVPRYRAHSSLPTLQEYLEKNPKAKSPNGAKCVYCGSNSIYLHFLYGPENGFGPKSHICRGCGKALYRS